MLDVEIDVGRPVTLGREEPLEEQAERDGVGLGDAERVADRAVGGAAPTLAVDVVAVAELDDVDEHEEVAGEAELLDHVELVGDLSHRLLVLLVGGRIADGGASRRELAQPAHLGVTGRHVVVGQLGRGEAEVERARRRDLERALDRAGPAREPALLLGRAAQVRERRGRQPAVDLVERPAGAYRGEGLGERTASGGGVVHVVRRDDLDPDAHRDLCERVVAVTVERIAVIPQLHEHPIPTEGVDQLGQRSLRGCRTVALQCGGHAALATTGEHEPVVVGRARAVTVHRCPGRVDQLRRRRSGRPLLPRELRLADRLGEAGVSRRALREHDQVLAGGIRHPVGRPNGCVARAERQLGAEHCRQRERPGRLCEAHDTVEAVVIGDRERGQIEARRFFGQLLGVAGTVEEREVRMAVQLRVHSPGSGFVGRVSRRSLRRPLFHLRQPRCMRRRDDALRPHR